jgi:hypothetical protein
MGRLDSAQESLLLFVRVESWYTIFRASGSSVDALTQLFTNHFPMFISITLGGPHKLNLCNFLDTLCVGFADRFCFSFSRDRKYVLENPVQNFPI